MFKKTTKDQNEETWEKGQEARDQREGSDQEKVKPQETTGEKSAKSKETEQVSPKKVDGGAQVTK